MRGPALADSITGHSAAFSILAALFDRHRWGQGQHLEVSMLVALVHVLHSSVSKKIVDGQEVGPYGRAHGSQAYVFVARDKKLLLIHLSTPPKFWEGLCAAAERPDLMTDPRFGKYAGRRQNL